MPTAFRNTCRKPEVFEGAGASAGTPAEDTDEFPIHRVSLMLRRATCIFGITVPVGTLPEGAGETHRSRG